MGQLEETGLEFVRAEAVDSDTFFGIENLHYLDSEGHAVVRSVVRHPGVVVIVPISGQSIVMIRQYRASVDKMLLELPAGKLDVDGESRESAARRECEEEIGFRPGRLRELCSFLNSPGFTDEHATIYVGDGLVDVGRSPMGPEEVASVVVTVPIEEIRAMLDSGDITDGKTLIGLMAYLRTQDNDGFNPAS